MFQCVYVHACRVADMMSAFSVGQSCIRVSFSCFLASFFVVVLFVPTFVDRFLFVCCF